MQAKFFRRIVKELYVMKHSVVVPQSNIKYKQSVNINNLLRAAIEKIQGIYLFIIRKNEAVSIIRNC